ncbi:MAG TPA: tyrosine-type recombinase/integrase [Arachidicoccus soli]|nr:tyrosine-type recombinase/integrase [Arachidicoccus soli]
MEQTHTFAVDFLVRKSKTDKSIAFIYARITLDGESREISIQEEIKTKDWDAKKEAVKGRSIEVQSINEHIESVRSNIKQKYRDLKLMDELLTADGVKQAYLGKQFSLKGHKLKELLDYYKKIWEQKLDNGGFKNYRTTIDYVKRFLAFKFKTNKDVYLSQVNMEFMTELEHYIRIYPIKENDPCLGNGLGKQIQRFKTIIKWSKTIKWSKENQAAEYPCNIKKNKRKKLSIEQLVTLENKSFLNERLQFVRDLFLFSCYTGLAYAEVMKLDESHFEWDTNGITWCLIYRDKTEGLCPVPLIKSAITILDKYRAIRKPEMTRIFPRITNKDVNDYLKNIQEIYGIPFDLTFHIARHTFAKTVALKNGIPLETVQMMLGHTKIATTQIYADVDEEKILDDTFDLEEKLELKRARVKEHLQSSGTII